MRLRLTDSNRPWWILVTMTGALSMTLLDQTVVSVALPSIQRDLDVDQTALQWVVNAYLLALAALVAVGGRLGDLFGQGRMFKLGVTIFFVASAACGFAADEPMIIVSRAIQGAGAALMIPPTGALVMNAFAVEERGRAMGIYAGISMVFLALGPLVGGVLTELVTWRAVFWINIPLGIAILLVGHLSLAGKDHRQPDAAFDWPGFATLVPALTGIVLALMQSQTWGWGSPATIGLLGGGLLLLVAFVVVELRAAQPLVELKLFRSSNFRADSIALGCVEFALMGLGVFGAIWIQNVLGYNPIEAGLSLLPVMLPLVLIAPSVGKLYGRIGPRLPVAAGCLLVAIGIAVSAALLSQESFPLLIPGYVAMGFGIGLIMTPSNTDAMNTAPPQLRGQASGVVQTVRQVGGTVGLAVLGTVVASVQQSRIDDFIAADARTDPSQAALIERALSETDPAKETASAGLPPQAVEAASGALTDAISAAYYVGAGTLLVAAIIALVVLRKVAAADAPDAHPAVARSAPTGAPVRR